MRVQRMNIIFKMSTIKLTAEELKKNVTCLQKLQLWTEQKNLVMTFMKMGEFCSVNPVSTPSYT